MSDENENSVSLTQEEYQSFLADKRALQAGKLGFDMSNPATELALEKFWENGMADEDLVAIRDKYNLKVQEKETEEDNSSTPPPTPKVDEVNPGGNEPGDMSAFLNDPNGLPGDIQLQADPKTEAKNTYERMLKEGLSADDARVAALDTLFKTAAQTQALERIRSRRQDEQTVANALALENSRQA